MANGVPNHDGYEAYINLKAAGDTLAQEIEKELLEGAAERAVLEDALRDVRAITAELKH